MPGATAIGTQEAKGHLALSGSNGPEVVSSADRLEHMREQRAATWELIRSSVPDLVRILELWDAMIAQAGGQALESVASESPAREAGPYSSFDNAADALVAYLQEHGPTLRLDAMKAVVDGGWAHDEADAMGLMRDAVYYQLKRATKPRVKVCKGDLLDIA